MEFISKNQAQEFERNGILFRYYKFKEYFLGFCEQPPATSHNLHHHAKLWETIVILEGKLVARWIEDRKEKEKIVAPGDVIEVGRAQHSFENRSQKVAKFIFLKQVLSGEDKKDILETDKSFG